MNILVLTYWSFEDALIQTYTLPYISMIVDRLPKDGQVFLFTLDQVSKPLPYYQIQRETLQDHGVHVISHSYTPFGLMAAWRWLATLFRLWWLIVSRQVSHIHVFCTPAGVAGYILSLLTGKPLILDSYEPHAEAMVENGTWAAEGWAFRILSWFEKRMTRRAQAVIATTQGMLHYAQERYQVTPRPFYVKPACVDLEQFDGRLQKDVELVQALGLQDKLVCVYAGKVGGIYLDQEIFDFFAVAAEYWGQRFRVVMLSNVSRQVVESYCLRAGFDASQLIVQFVPHHEIARYLSLGDFALNPVRPVPTKRYCTSIKDGEYWAMGLPVVITPDISDDSEIIASYDIGVVLSSLDAKGYRKAVEDMDRLLSAWSRQEMIDRVRQVARQYRDVAIAENVYYEIYHPDRVI